MNAFLGWTNFVFFERRQIYLSLRIISNKATVPPGTPGIISVLSPKELGY
jgi:hypothetical protein